MRILFIGINYWPEQTAVAPFATGRCEYLAGRGHEVIICTAFPFYPHWRIAPEYRGRLFARETRNRVTILRCPLYVPRRVTSVRRILHEASFLATALTRALASTRPEILFITSPPLSLALAGIILSRLWGVPYVFHAEDLQPDAALDLGMLPASGRLARGLYALERAAYRHASLVSTITAAMRRRIISKDVAEAKVAVFSGWADPALFGIQPGGGQELRRALGFEGRFLAVHIGNMGVKQGLEVILGAAQRTVEDAQILYLLVGDGAMRPALEQRAQAMALANLRFLPLQPAAVFHQILAAADLGLVTQHKSVADIVFPSKLLSWMAAGTPVAAAVNADSEAARVLQASGMGMTVAAEDPGALADAVRALGRNPQRRRAMGERGRACALADWNRERILPLMEARLHQLLDARAATGTRRGQGVPAPAPTRAALSPERKS